MDTRAKAFKEAKRNICNSNMLASTIEESNMFRGFPQRENGASTPALDAELCAKQSVCTFRVPLYLSKSIYGPQ